LTETPSQKSSRVPSPVATQNYDDMEGQFMANVTSGKWSLTLFWTTANFLSPFSATFSFCESGNVVMCVVLLVLEIDQYVATKSEVQSAEFFKVIDLVST